MTKELVPAPLPAPTERLSLREASRLLNVTRVHVLELAETGKLGPELDSVAGERWYARSGVLAYRAEMKKRQRKGLKQMIEASERAGLYLYEDQCMANLRELAASKANLLEEEDLAGAGVKTQGQGAKTAAVLSRVGSDGRATVPATVLHAIGAKPGTRLSWSSLSGDLVIISTEPGALHDIYEILARSGPPAADIEDATP